MDLCETPKSKADWGVFFFCIEGLPAEFTWQELKDLARKKAPSIGWTEMFPGKKAQEESCGWIRVKREIEAYALFDFLEHDPLPNRRLRVSLWLTLESPPDLLASNCLHLPTAPLTLVSFDSTARTTPSQLSINGSPRSVTSRAQPNLLTMASSLFNTRPITQSPGNAFAKARPSLPIRPHHSIQARTAPSVGRPSSTDIYGQDVPVNVKNGFVVTEPRGVWIGGLNFSTKTRRLKRCLATAGVLESCKIARDAHGRSRGYGLALFVSNVAALRAAQLLDGTIIDGKTVSVRLDKEKSSIPRNAFGRGAYHQEKVVIANGSGQSKE